MIDVSGFSLAVPEGQTLRPYQEEGAKHLLVRKRMYLADQPGLGKTVQVTTALYNMGQIPDTLIVCPKSAIGVWERHIKEWCGVEPKTFTTERASYRDIKSPGVLITNYEQMDEVLRQRDYWPVMVFDEAHKLRNRKTKAYKTAKQFVGSYVWLLSGTPVFKGAHDLWAPLAMLYPNKFPYYWSFINTYAFKDRVQRGDRSWQNVYGIKDPKKLARDIQPFFFRRLKADVLTDLPEKNRFKIPLHMTPVQTKHYKELYRKMMTETEDTVIMAQSGAVKALKLRQLLVSPRLLGIDDDGAAIPALLEEMEDTQQPLTVWTPFRASVKLIAEAARSIGWDAYELTSAVRDTRTRDGLVETFQTSKNPNRVLVCTLGIGESWTATAAQRTRFVGYDWAPQVNIQAEDRMHRYGGTGYECGYYVHKDSMDDRMMEVNSEKITIENLTMNHDLILNQ